MTVCAKCNYDNSVTAITCAVCTERLSVSVTESIANAPEKLIGRVVNGKYEVLSLLGEGGMGVVYKVRHLLLQKNNDFALKILHPRFSADKAFQARFLREVEVTMQLTHENIVQIRDFGMTEGGFLFFTMDFFPGCSLKDALARCGPFSPARAVRIARQLLLALREANRIGVIHRDLKPDNVLVDGLEEQAERVRVLDFGIAKLLESDEAPESLTQESVIGTPKYMSPEQASGEKIDHRSDLYSLGVLLYEMLAGTTPFSAGSTRGVLLGHMTQPPPPFADSAPTRRVPSELDALVFRLLSKDPDDRPESAEVVLGMLDTEPTLVAGRVTARPRNWQWAWVAVCSAAAFLLAFGFSQWGSWNGDGTSGTAHAEAAPPARPSAGGAAPQRAASGAETRPPRREVKPVVRLRCEVCSGTYDRGEKVGNMCHGLPLLELEQGE